VLVPKTIAKEFRVFEFIFMTHNADIVCYMFNCILMILIYTNVVIYIAMFIYKILMFLRSSVRSNRWQEVVYYIKVELLGC
jgi:hypothetical protein